MGAILRSSSEVSTLFVHYLSSICPVTTGQILDNKWTSNGRYNGIRKEFRTQIYSHSSSSKSKSSN